MKEMPLEQVLAEIEGTFTAIVELELPEINRKLYYLEKLCRGGQDLVDELERRFKKLKE